MWLWKLCIYRPKDRINGTYTYIHTNMYNAYWRECVLRKVKEPCHAMMASHAKEGLMKKSESEWRALKETSNTLSNKYLLVYKLLFP